MADVESEGRIAVLIPGAHRVVRTLDPAEGPFAGTLVTRGDGVAVRVDAAALAGWAAWRFAGAEHVAAPVDVVRRADGHDALLPWCTDRVLGFLVRRAATGSALSSGECSTLVVSLLRGLDELGVGADAVQTGVWWLTDGGRPIFVIGAGGDARAETAEIVERLAEGCVDKALTRLLTSINQGLVKALAQPRVPARLLEDWERELLATAAPRPLGREVHAPERARDVARAATMEDRRSSPARATRRADHRPAPRRPSSASRRVKARRADATRRARVRLGRLAAGSAAIRAAAESVRLRVRSGRDRPQGERDARGAVLPDAGAQRSRRRRALVVAGAAAAVVLAGGLLWPGGGAGETADAAPEGSTAEQEPDSSAVEAGEEPAETVDEGDGGGDEKVSSAPSPPEGDDGPAAAASALLTRVVECFQAQDLVCADAVARGSEAVIEPLAAAAGREAVIELVDEYGDVAVIRVGSPGGTSGEEGEPAAAPDQMLVLVRQDEEWLVRDVYGVADQPG